MTASDPKRLAEVKAVIRQLNRSRYKQWSHRSQPRNPVSRSYFDKATYLLWDETGWSWIDGRGPIWFLQSAIDWTGISKKDEAKLLLKELGRECEGTKLFAQLTAEAGGQEFDHDAWFWERFGKTPCDPNAYQGQLRDDEIPF